MKLSCILRCPFHALRMASDGHGVRGAFHCYFDVVAGDLKLVVLVQAAGGSQLLGNGEDLFCFSVHGLDLILGRLLLVVMESLETVELVLVMEDTLFHEFAAGVGYEAATSTGSAETELGCGAVDDSRPSTHM